MSSGLPVTGDTADQRLPRGEALKRNIQRRKQIGRVWHVVLFASTVVGILVLVILLARVVNDAVGLVAVERNVDPATLADRPLAQLDAPALIGVLEANLSANRLENIADEQALSARSPAELRRLIDQWIVRPEIVGSWPLHEMLFKRAEIEATVAEDFPAATLEFQSWLDWQFIVNPMSSTPAEAGVRTAILGSLWMIAITMLFAVPIGIGAAIYLEEYATDNWFHRIIQTNINNLAGVPSIIYGILGLAIFVRALVAITSGAFLSGEEPQTANGRTVLAAGLTMGLLVLPIVIISAQEAIRSVPTSLRQASYGLGATRWQTIRRQVLPNAFPGILTGTILAMSRAIGETAPLIVVGASTFILVDPDGPFAQFTALPIQIFNWTARPQDQFRDIAAAAIIVLLLMLLTLNATAVLLRNYLNKRKEAA